MKTFFQIDLSRMPDTYDIVHVGLGCMVLVLFMMLFVVSMLLFITLFRKLKITPDDVVVQTQANKPELVPVTAVATPTPEPKVKIVEKVIEKSVPGPAPKPVIIREISPDAATQLLSLLQKEARFIDFVKEDISNQSDSDVGVVARIVHEGCAKVVQEHFSLSPVRKEQENSQVTLNENFDANQVSLTGNIIGKPPFTGTLVHKGWQVSEIRLPKITEGHDVNIITPAEVEL